MQFASSNSDQDARDCDISRWTFRKRVQKNARNHASQYVAYLQSLLSEHNIAHYDIKSFKGMELQNSPIPIKLDHHLLNLERYSEEYASPGIENSDVGDIGNLSDIGQQTGHRPYGLYTEATVAESVDGIVNVPGKAVRMEIPKEGGTDARDKRDPMQCQICKEVFSTRNLLFEHLESKCLADRVVRGEFVRSGRDDKAHRAKWRARSRDRREKASKDTSLSGGGLGEKTALGKHAG